jgi:hypothetical protein
MKNSIDDVENLDKFAVNQILPNVRKELGEYGDIQNACLCFTGLNRDGYPVFHSLQDDGRPTYHEWVSELARSCQARKVLLVSDTYVDACLQVVPKPSDRADGQRAIVIFLILPDGSLEWTITQTYKTHGKWYAWDEPKKMDGGFQNLIPAWGSPATAN